MPVKNEKAISSPERVKENLFSTNIRDEYVTSIESPAGLRFDLYYEENSPKDNPIIIAKGLDERGNRFEQRFAVKDIDPSNASYVEMCAWDAYYQPDRDGYGCLHFPSKADDMGLNDRANFVFLFEENIQNNIKIGDYGTANYYKKHLESLLQSVKKEIILKAEEDIDHMISTERMRLGILLNSKK